MQRGIQLHNGDIFPHFIEPLGDAKAEVAKADQYDVLIHGGGDGHLPLLVTRPPVEQQTAEIGQPEREDDQPDDGHHKVKQLQTEISGKVPGRLQERSG